MISQAEWESRFSRIQVGHVASGGHASQYSSGLILMEILDNIGFVPVGTFLDFGCGNGRMVPHAAPMVDEYIGVDVMPGVLDFCRQLTRDVPNTQFVHLDAKNPMYPGGEQDRVPIPMEDNSVDTAVALSVFTHLASRQNAEYYLDEFQRVLKPGGIAAISWFRSPPNELCDREERTVYEFDWIQRQLTDRFSVGLSQGGESTGWNDQWFVCLRNA